MKKNYSGELFLLGFLTIYGISFFAWSNIFLGDSYQQFVHLANSFINGKLHFMNNAGFVYDASYYKNHFYWPLGPLPAIILMPFVFFFGLSVYQGMIQFLLICICLLLLFKISQKVLVKKIDAIWLSFGYIFSTAFIGTALIPWAWQFAQVVATVFLLNSLYEYLYYKRWFVVGLFLALAIAVRADLMLASLFFIANILVMDHSVRKKITNIILFFIPIGISVCLLLIYNYLRFDNIFDQGYLYQNLTTMELISNRTAGLWSPIHIPANLYYFFLQGPEAVFIKDSKILTFPFLAPNPWGMSIFFTSPMFLWIVMAPYKKKEVVFATITSVVLAIAIFGYYGIGYMQYGYRYALDFYPFLFLILLYAVKNRVSTLLKVVILLSFFFNLYMNHYLFFS